MLTKTELVEQVQGKLASTKGHAETALDAVVDVIAGALGAGDEVSLFGLGKFSIIQIGERRGRNPQTGESMKIAPHKRLKFAPAGPLKQRVAKL